METEIISTLTKVENTNKSQEPRNILLTTKEFLSPKLIAEYCNQGFIKGSEAVRLYISASIVSRVRQGKDCFERTTTIAKKLNVSPALVRQTIKRQCKISRAGYNGQRGGRNWILIGINDKQKIIQP